MSFRQSRVSGGPVDETGMKRRLAEHEDTGQSGFTIAHGELGPFPAIGLLRDIAEREAVPEKSCSELDSVPPEAVPTLGQSANG